ncbi:serine recombinase PinE [Camelimonas fluminis]|uniref:DNA invertase Pin-like site-specific DNA recombinase n=2 Tax=Camelimonas TaxID=1017183 RepID=A0A4R2GFL1_9HYPH|nr:MULTISPECIES: recombinase family protein [Camelimonas]TCO06998.1 DNA invertase Pin-like site-specific DNA recombinase [Camelimonas lactis]GHE83296.1 serine recombinase PinE [Camelimonas fluminis]
MAVFGYILAADEDDVHMQAYDLQYAGAADPYTDYGEDGQTDRPQLEVALTKLAHGDTLVVTGLDRLAPSSEEVMVIIRRVADKGAELWALWDKTSITPGDVQRASQVIVVLEGIDAAHALRKADEAAATKKNRRSNAGRPKKLTPEQVSHARLTVDSGQQSVSSMAKVMRVNKTTLWRALKTAPSQS